jgi:2-polyprenyl-6-methoxyphenol hydroxylase-like FAD-dependent oxidoreductase
MPADPADSQPLPSSSTTCVIAGGGPAGMMLGLLLARAGIKVTVLEKHKDFFRDFRGDTIHTSTLEVLRELGLLEAFQRLPHQKAYNLSASFGSDSLTIADFRHLPTPCKYVAFMPQWDFLDFLARQAKRHPAFSLRMATKANGLLRTHGRVSGVRVKTPQGYEEIHADLVVACDGRHSELRHQSGLPVIDLGAPIDALWFRLPREKTDSHEQLVGRLDRGQLLAMIDRGDYWQCAYVIPKGSFADLQQRGLAALQADLEKLVPFAAGRMATAIRSFDDLKLLEVQVNRLHRWHAPGFLCIGDAAHAMSPVGGVGINLAIQDAVAAANLLVPALQEGPVPDRVLEQIQARRERPTKMIQGFQIRAQSFLFETVLRGEGPLHAPWMLKLMTRLPGLRAVIPRFIALGPYREHVVRL